MALTALPACKRAGPAAYTSAQSSLETSVAGRDVNSDNIRDDVNASIAAYYTGPESVALSVYAQALQLWLLADGPWKLREAFRAEAEASACLRVAFPEDAAARERQVRTVVLNTPVRRARMREAREAHAALGVTSGPATCRVMAAP